MNTILNDGYTKECERKDRELFSRWCEKSGCFTWTGTTGKGDSYDVRGMLRDGRECMIELKYRDIPHDKYDDVMIEGDKLCDGLLFYHLSGLTPLYINIYNDGWLSVHNLATINQPRKDKVRRINPGLGNKVIENATYFLSAEDGYYDEG